MSCSWCHCLCSSLHTKHARSLSSSDSGICVCVYTFMRITSLVVLQGYGHCDILDDWAWEGEHLYNRISIMDVHTHMNTHTHTHTHTPHTPHHPSLLQSAVLFTFARQTRPMTGCCTVATFQASWPPGMAPTSRATQSSSSTSQPLQTCRCRSLGCRWM